MYPRAGFPKTNFESLFPQQRYYSVVEIPVVSSSVKFFTPKYLYRPVFPPQVRIQQVLSLSLFFLSSLMWFSQWPKVLNHSFRPQFSLTQVTAHFLFLLLWSIFFRCYRSFSCPGGETERERYMERVWDCWRDRKKREAENQRGSTTYVKTAQRRSERQRKQPAHVHEADGVSVWGRRRGEGGWWRVRWERRYFSAPSQRERERETESGGGDLLFMCVR